MEMKRIFMLLVLVLASAGVLHAKKLPAEPTLTFYQFEQYFYEPGAEANDVISASPTGNMSFYAFGNFGVAQHVVRESASNTSKVIGRAPLWFSPDKEEGRFNFFGSYTLETEEYKGSLVVSGDDDFNLIVNEFAVLGGTASFRLAKGYGLITIVEVTPKHEVYKVDLYLLKLPKSHKP